MNNPNNNNINKDFDPWLEEVLGNKYINHSESNNSNIGISSNRIDLKDSIHNNFSDNYSGSKSTKQKHRGKFFKSKFFVFSSSFLILTIAFFIFYAIYFGQKESSKFKNASNHGTNYENSASPQNSENPSPSTKKSQTPSPSPTKSSINKATVHSNLNKLLTYSEENIIEVLGNPSRKDVNEYAYTQFIYKNDYSKFIMLGVKNGSCSSLYTNSNSYSLYNIKIGDTKSSCEQKLSSTGYSRKINDTWSNGSFDFDAFYDQFNNNKLTGILISKKINATPITLSKNSNNPTLNTSLELELFNLVNSIRNRNKLPSVLWDAKANTSSRKHSIDMANNDFFAHTNLKGIDPFTRMKSEGISFTSASENIAAGQKNSIFAFEALMNSSGHRKNILGNFTKLGTGVAQGPGKYLIYYTQNFYTPM